MALCEGGKLRNWSSVFGSGFSFYCPGCKCAHTLPVAGGYTERWGFNGDTVKPTFTPSVLVFHEKDGQRVTECHSFVTDGRIQFLNDSAHELAGQTVDLPLWPENYGGP